MIGKINNQLVLLSFVIMVIKPIITKREAGPTDQILFNCASLSRLHVVNTITRAKHNNMKILEYTN